MKPRINPRIIQSDFLWIPSEITEVETGKRKINIMKLRIKAN
jgi:hypothetical protein